MKKLVAIIAVAVLSGSVAQAKGTNTENKIISMAAKSGWKVDTSIDKADNKIYLIKKVKERIRYNRLRAEVSYTDKVVNVTIPSSNVAGFSKMFKINSELRKLKNAIMDG